MPKRLSAAYTCVQGGGREAQHQGCYVAPNVANCAPQQLAATKIGYGNYGRLVHGNFWSVIVDCAMFGLIFT